MTKRDYQLIANVLRAQLDAIDLESVAIHRFMLTEQVIEIATNFVNTLIQDNPRFDKDKFMDACIPRVIFRKHVNTRRSNTTILGT